MLTRRMLTFRMDKEHKKSAPLYPGNDPLRMPGNLRHCDLDEEFQKKRDFVEEYTPLTKETYGVMLKNFRRKEILWKSTHHLPRSHMGQQGVALAVNDFSSGIMTASAGDANSTKELKGFKKPKMIQRKYTIQFQKLQKSTSSLQVFS